MIERVGSTFQSLQGLEASRSFQAAGKSGSIFKKALEQELQEVQAPTSYPKEDEAVRLDLQHSTPESLPAAARQTSQPVQPKYNPQLNTLIQEVRQIAESTGFVGVSSQDVLRAYQGGQSFLADYKV